MRARTRVTVLIAGLLTLAGTGSGQIVRPLPEEWQAPVEAGDTAALEQLLGERGDPLALGARALAHAARAAAAGETAAFEQAAGSFAAWIASLERSWPGLEAELQTAERAAARIRCARMIIGDWCAADLDRFAISGGRERAAELPGRLVRADDLLGAALHDLRPLLEAAASARGDVEDRLITLGLFESAPALAKQARFHRGWTIVQWLAVDPPEGARRGDLRRIAERCLGAVLEAGVPDDAAARCELGLALLHADAGQWTDAARRFAAARERAADSVLLAEIRCRQAALAISRDQYDEARALLAALTEVDVERIPAEQNGLRFYANWAQLLAGDALLREAGAAAASAAARSLPTLERHAGRTRAQAFGYMLALAGRGGPWPELVDLYVDPHLRTAASESPSAAEAVLRGMRAMRADDPRTAVTWLERARQHETIPRDEKAEALYWLGRAHAALDDTALALDAAEAVVRQHPDHHRAPAALTQAYQLRARIAEASRSPEDYRQLAQLLRVLVERFPLHERRLEATWWLPSALQAAGDWSAAATAYAAVPAESPRWEEAQWRRVQCRFEAWRAADAANAEDTEALRAGLAGYAEAALRRAGETGDRLVTERATEALLLVAELELAPQLDRPAAALETLQEVARRADSEEQQRRLLLARVRALVALERWDAVEATLTRLDPGGSPESTARLMPLLHPLLARLVRLADGDDPQAARTLAGLLAPLARHALRDARIGQLSTGQQQAVRFGAARCLLLADDVTGALALTGELVAAEPGNAAYLHLHAEALTLAADRGKSAEAIGAARAAWAALCRPELRRAAPQRYWEARYHFLRLLKAEGRTEDVRRAIEQEQLWFPELGGDPWGPRIEALGE